MRFILFRGSSLYGSVDRMLESLAAAFIAQGDDAPIVEASGPTYVAHLQRAIAEGPVDAFIGFTGIGLDLRAEGNLYNLLDRPLVSIYLDPLLLYWNQIVTPIRRRLIFTTAPGDVDYWCGTLGVTVPIAHLPHAAMPAAEGTMSVPWDEREIALLHAGTAPDDPATLRAGWAQHGRDVEARLNDMLDALDAEPLAPLPEIIARIGAPWARPDAPQTLHAWFQTLDTYLRARIRWRMILPLLSRDLTLAGPGWDKVAATTGSVRATLIGAQPASEIARLTARSKIVVNTCTPYHGSHERLFQAMAAGAVALTSPTIWLADTAPAAALVQTSAAVDDAAALVDALLTDPGRAAAMAATGQAWFQDGHTWMHRAAVIKTALQT
jgi:hypothetical protein